jgi:hypothetical protein
MCDVATLLMSYGCSAGMKHGLDGRREINHARTRDNDRVPSAVRFFRDPEKSAAIVFTKLHVKTLPFYLEFFRLDNAVHFRKRRSLGQSAYRMEANSAGALPAV